MRMCFYSKQPPLKTNLQLQKMTSKFTEKLSSFFRFKIFSQSFNKNPFCLIPKGIFPSISAKKNLASCNVLCNALLKRER